jgi:predicted transcriptional regulator
MNGKELELVRMLFDIIMIIWIILNPGIKRLGNIIKLMDINIQAIDRGIEESIKNGYAKARDKELRRLMDKEKFKRSS